MVIPVMVPKTIVSRVHAQVRGHVYNYQEARSSVQLANTDMGVSNYWLHLFLYPN